jgi:hypothetical protein
MDRGQPIPAHQIGADLLIQLIVLEQAIQLDQDGIGLIGQFGHAGTDVFGRIAVDEHTASLLLQRASLLILPPADPFR